jgi:hypothetical protein
LLHSVQKPVISLSATRSAQLGQRSAIGAGSTTRPFSGSGYATYFPFVPVYSRSPRFRTNTYLRSPFFVQHSNHHLTDRLLFLSRRYKRVLAGVKKATYAQWLGEWKAKKPGTEGIVKLEWKNGTVVIVRTGLHPTGGKKGPSGQTLSIYFFLLQDFDPFVGRPEEQRYLARGFTSLDQHIKHAANQQRLPRC